MKRLGWEDYFERTVKVQMHFDLAKEALSSFKETPEAVKNYSDKGLIELRKLLSESFKKKNKSPLEHWAFSEDGARRYLESVQSYVPKQLDEFINILNQNEIILRISLYETFMKDIQRQVLWLNPSIIKPDRTIPLGRLLSYGYKKIIEEEIEKEIKNVDYLPIEGQATYFRDKLGLDWFEGHAVPLLKHILEVRNNILHENPNRIINNIDMGVTVMMCTAIPFVCIAQAAVLYPKGFRMIKGTRKADIRKAMKVEETDPINQHSVPIVR